MSDSYPGDPRATLVVELARSLRDRGTDYALAVSHCAQAQRSAFDDPLADDAVQDLVRALFDGAERVVLPEPTPTAPEPEASVVGPWSEPEFGPRPEPGVDGLDYTPGGNADRLLRDHGHELLYVDHPWSTWYAWVGTHWAEDPGQVLVAQRLERVTAGLLSRALEVDADEQRRLLRWIVRSRTPAVVRDSAWMARHHFRAEYSTFERDPKLFNCRNGTLDFNAGTFRRPSPADRLIRVAPVYYDPAAACPDFDRFVERVLPDDEVRGFAQRLLGLCLTGLTERALLIFYGGGQNGKTTLLNIVKGVLGPGYALTVPRELIVAQRHEGHDTKYVDLFRARLAFFEELREDETLNEARVKWLTGNSQIRARRMREDYWQFDPTHKLVVACNHLPRVRAEDQALWDRLKVVPFDVRIPDEEKDRDLADRVVQREASGVLNWLVRGLAEYFEVGLTPPAGVAHASEFYRVLSDTVQQFLNEEVRFQPDALTETHQLRAAHTAWCGDRGVPDVEAHWLRVTAAFGGHKGERQKYRGSWHWRGVALRHDADSEGGL